VKSCKLEIMVPDDRKLIADNGNAYLFLFGNSARWEDKYSADQNFLASGVSQLNNGALTLTFAFSDLKSSELEFLNQINEQWKKEW
jgi:hypothetical protein